MEIIGNVRVGKPDIDPSAPAHTKGVREGNERTVVVREPGIKRLNLFMAAATPRRSTGVNASARTPIDPRMPVITPA
jgi:hypothetical protein